MTATRQTFIGGLSAVTASFAARPLAAQASEIRLAAVTSLSGPFVLQGEETLRAIRYATEEVNADGGIAGRRVVVEAGDDEGTPEAGRRVAERLALQGFRLITGPISSSVSLAPSTHLERWNALYVVNNSKADRITGDACRSRMVRCTQSDAMDIAVVRPWLAERKERRVAVVAGDYAWGRSSAEGFLTEAKASARQSEPPIFVPLGTRDFAPYITQLRDSAADLIWVALIGQDAINFGQQANSFGLFAQKTVFGHHLLLSQFVETLGGVLSGVWGNLPWSPEIDTRAKRAFVQGWQPKFARVPAENEASAYIAARLILDAVRPAGTDDPTRVLAEIRGARFETLLGPCRVRSEDNQMEMPNLLGRVGESDGRWRARLQHVFDASSISPRASADCRMRT